MRLGLAPCANAGPFTQENHLAQLEVRRAVVFKFCTLTVQSILIYLMRVCTQMQQEMYERAASLEHHYLFYEVV
jgi:hypothetical protein